MSLCGGSRMRIRVAAILVFHVTVALLFGAGASCGSSQRDNFADPDTGVPDADTFGEGGDASGLGQAPPDPKTCAEAAAAKSYVGCDYWPTVTSNIVSDVFDYAVA